MLQRLHVRNFTVFAEADFAFGPGLNVIVGANGTGKSHVLKLGYAVARSSNKAGLSVSAQRHLYGASPTLPSLDLAAAATPGFGKENWQKALANDLVATFRPDSLGRLVRRTQGRARSEVSVEFTQRMKATVSFSFSTNSKTEVVLEADTPAEYALAPPVFIPTKELLSLFPGLRELYDKFHLAIDITYPDLCDLLRVPLLRGPKANPVTQLLVPLEQMLGGAIRNENGRFYLYQKEGSRLEIDLVAEGIRKLATVAFLLHNGSLNRQTTLFWDEPEANLNPALIKELAALLLQLTELGFQIILATHSLFLLKEFHILAQQQPGHIRYFGLSADAGQATRVATADELPLLPDIVALDAELTQSDAFLSVLNADDAHV